MEQDDTRTVIWKCIPSDDEVTWVDRVAKPTISKSPLGDYGAVVQEMLDKGMSAESIARFARIVGYETAFSICYALEDPDLDANGDDAIAWGLFRTDPDTAAPIEPISSGYESLLSTDPTGISTQSMFRGRWLAYYTKTHFHSLEINTEQLPYTIEPMWPGRKVAVLLASSDTETWIMSDGLSNLVHPSDDINWDRIVKANSPEIVSRVPTGTIDHQASKEELALNPYIQLFIRLTCVCLQLHSKNSFRDNDHLIAPLDIESIENMDEASRNKLILFSNAESLKLAEPIQLPDHDYLRVQVLFATLVDQVDKDDIEADASVLSRTLHESRRLGVL